MNYSRREQTGWYFYDWANSGFSSTVITLFLGPYLTAAGESRGGSGRLCAPAGHSGGCAVVVGIPGARSRWPLQVVCLPVVGAIADYSTRKKSLLAIFA